MWNEKDVKIEKAKGDRGNPDYKPLGAGQFKLSGDDHPDEMMLAICQHLSKAVLHYKLKLDVPTNADDYLKPDALRLLITPAQLRSKRLREKMQNARYDKAKRAAYTIARRKFTVPGVRFMGWNSVWFHVGFTSGSRPHWMCYTFKTGNQKHSELFRDKDGRGVLLFPSMGFVQNTRAWVSSVINDARCIGLSAPGDIARIALYGLYPSSEPYTVEKIRIADRLRRSMRVVLGADNAEGARLGVLSVNPQTRAIEVSHDVNPGGVYMYALEGSRTRRYKELSSKRREHFVIPDRWTLAQIMCVHRYGVLPWEDVPRT